MRTTEHTAKPLTRKTGRFAVPFALLRARGSGAALANRASSALGLTRSSSPDISRQPFRVRERLGFPFAALALAVLTNVRLRVAGAERTKIRLLAPLCLTALLALAATPALAAPPAEFGSEGSGAGQIDHPSDFYVADQGAPA